MKKNIILGLLMCLVSVLNAQVGIGTTTPNASAALEVQSSNRGLLIPRMTTAQRDAVVSPAVGLLIFNTTTNSLNYFVGTIWLEAQGSLLPRAAALGSTFTTYSNGGTTNENFSANTTCQNSLISAGYISSNCSGSIAVGSNNYNVVLINGQCWMQDNLNEVPTAPCAAAPNTGCNTWLSSTPGDIGAWGYYNTTTVNGTAGWRTTENAPKEGLLYQWSAALNGDLTERTRGVCPAGWHIPSDCEWMYLEHGQGMSIAEQNIVTPWRVTGNVGSKLSMLTTNGNNSTGFTALLASSRFSGNTSNIGGSFPTPRNEAAFWTSTTHSTTLARRRLLRSSESGVFRSNHDKGNAYAVRCLRD